MKTIIQIILLGAFMFPGANEVQAQKAAKETKTIEFRVSSVCGMCKSRIENGALIKGVKLAEYNQETDTLKVIYRADKVTEDQIHKAVAAIGHDTEKVKATDEAYQKLPGCCAYRSDLKKH